MTFTPEQLAYHARWKAASGHPSGLWRVVREFPGRTTGPTMEQLTKSTGSPVLFRSFLAAEKRADLLNRPPKDIP